MTLLMVYSPASTLGRPHGARSLSSLKSRHRPIHALSDIGMFHMLAVPGKTDVAFSIYDNQAAGAAGFGAEEGDGYLGCFACCLSTRYKIGGAFGYEQASEIFTKYHTRMRLLSGTGRNAVFLYWGSG